MTSFRYLAGPGVDAHLNTEGALAQAITPNTVLIGSRVLQLPPRLQALIAAHELAHLMQLNRPGNDPVRALEAEAWEAAATWLAGRPYRIKGRANRPLNAVALIQEKAHPFAEEWYRLGESEPIGNKSSIKVDKVHVLQAMTLESILDKLIELKGTTEVVIVCHGSGGGLAIPATTGSTAGADSITLEVLATDQASEERGPAGVVKLPAISEERAQDITALKGDTQVRRIRAKMNAVRAMKLKHVAFRSCDTGRGKDTMTALLRFFGAASISAPRDYDSYGKFTPDFPVKNLDEWIRRKRASKYRVLTEGKIAYGTKKLSLIVYLIALGSSSDDAIAAWAKKHIRLNYTGGDIVYHAIVTDPQGSDSPSVLFVRDPSFAAGIVYMAR